MLATPSAADISGRARVIDGDSLQVAGESIRLSGIDALEMAQSCGGPQGDWACGVWARDVLVALIGGASVTCAGDERDRYGRLLAHCRVASDDLGAAMVGQGAAMAFRRYSMEYVALEDQARAQNRGLWRRSGDGVLPPAVFRAARREAQHRVETPAPVGCAIKGNISANGHIYHLPGQRDYDRTVVSPARDERWFCSEAEAQAAGWRPARR